MFSDNLGFNPFDKNNCTSIKNSARFLDSFKQNHIFVYNGNPRKKISSMSHTDRLTEAINANNSNGSDVYFYVNGGRKMYAINQFTSCFCDMDAGRDNEGKYFKPSVVMQHKKKFLEKINSFAVKPSWVVDTRNGYQCYWIFDDHSRKLVGKNKTYWNGLQKKLVNYFGGDPRAIKANQIYRVPYTWWRKVWEKKAPYFTSILPGSTGQPINVADLQSALTGQSTNIVIDPSKCSDEWYKGFAKAYKQADANNLPVSEDIARQILQQFNSGCGQKNSQESVDMNLDTIPLTVGNVKGVTLGEVGYEIDTGKFKIGKKDPTSGNLIIWENLDYAGGGVGGIIPGSGLGIDVNPTGDDTLYSILTNTDSNVKLTIKQSSDLISGADGTYYEIGLPWKSYSSDHKVYGDANPVVPGEVTQGGCLNLSGQQTKLLKTVVDYLNQASTALYFSNNRFLSTAAKDLANQLSDQFCIG